MTDSFTDRGVSIIIPVHNGGERFRRCLISVKKLQPPPMEVIVVADGNSDGSWKIAQQFDIQVLKRTVRGGPALARNFGANHAKGAILFFIDADVTVPNNIIEKILNSFQKDPDLDALIGSYDDKPSELNFLSQYKNLFHHYVHQTSSTEASTFWGACGVIRRDVFLKLGGFDKRYGQPSIEDIELGYRLKKSGYNIQLDKHIQVKHLKYWGIASLIKTDFINRAIPWTELILKDGRIMNDLNLNISSRISVAAVYASSICLIGSILVPWLIIPTIILGILLLGLNWDLYRFFKAKRGLIFVLMVIPWHWLYFLYSGLAFAIGYTKFLLNRIWTRKRAFNG
jgi:glycosyltransferase involved in cell wall biosynthesis